MLYQYVTFINFIISRFLDRSAYIYGLLIPSTILVLVTLTYLVRAAVVARYVASMQIDRRTRDKMRRKRSLQLFLFTKVIDKQKQNDQKTMTKAKTKALYTQTIELIYV